MVNSFYSKKVPAELVYKILAENIVH